MANSGPNGETLVGSWSGLRLPVERWWAWFWDDEALCSTNVWDDLPDAVLLIYVYHPGGKRTRMVAVDVYPPPPGVAGDPRLGYQVGEVDCARWRRVRELIEAQAVDTPWSTERAQS